MAVWGQSGMEGELCCSQLRALHGMGGGCQGESVTACPSFQVQVFCIYAENYSERTLSSPTALQRLRSFRGLMNTQG